jgi:hypothetical protein
LGASPFWLVLRLALLEHGAPTAIVSDGGSIFKANQVLRIYKELGIERRQIDSGQPWQNYIETAFNIGRRMEDHDFAQATTWAEMRAIHDRFCADYNLQPHWAHRQRKAGRRTPEAVLGPIHGVWCDEAELDRLFRIRSGRVFDAGGSVRYKRWRIYGERGLAKQRGEVWVFGEVLSVTFEDDTLAQYQVRYDPKTRAITRVTDARLF